MQHSCLWWQQADSPRPCGHAQWSQSFLSLIIFSTWNHKLTAKCEVSGKKGVAAWFQASLTLPTQVRSRLLLLRTASFLQPDINFSAHSAYYSHSKCCFNFMVTNRPVLYCFKDLNVSQTVFLTSSYQSMKEFRITIYSIYFITEWMFLQDFIPYFSCKLTFNFFFIQEAL